MNNEIINSLLRTDFKSFVTKVFGEVAPGSKYLNNWHIDVICDAIMDMYEGSNNRLMINMPPRYMKSLICSIALPAWILGHNPKAQILCVSYNDELADKEKKMRAEAPAHTNSSRRGRPLGGTGSSCLPGNWEGEAE